jgi:pimeloyl-ACP methyl ester carboxylesterase
MGTIASKDGAEIFYKDWGPRDAQPIVFHHGWPLSSDDWDAQLLYFLGKGYRVVAHDRRGHGRSSQVSDGHDMDHYAMAVSLVSRVVMLRLEGGRSSLASGLGVLCSYQLCRPNLRAIRGTKFRHSSCDG